MKRIKTNMLPGLHSRICALVFVVIGCGDGHSTAPPSGAPPEDPSDQRAFVPEGIEFQLFESGMMKIESSTFHDIDQGAMWFAAVRNMGDLACRNDIVAVFSDSNGETIGTTEMRIQASPYTGYEEDGCLATGEVGFGAIRLDVSTKQIASVLCKIEGYLVKDTTKVTNIGLEAVSIASSNAGTSTVRGDGSGKSAASRSGKSAAPSKKEQAR